jgi:hypothetical protein
MAVMKTPDPVPLPKGINPLSEDYARQRLAEKNAMTSQSKLAIAKAAGNAGPQGTPGSKLGILDMSKTNLSDTARSQGLRGTNRIFSAVIPTNPAAGGPAPSFHRTAGGEVKPPDGHAMQLSAPQLTGLRRKKKRLFGGGTVGVAGVAESALLTSTEDGKGEREGEDKPVFRCGDSAVALASFDVHLGGGVVEHVPKGSVIRDAGAISLCLSQDAPIVPAGWVGRRKVKEVLKEDSIEVKPKVVELASRSEKAEVEKTSGKVVEEK